MPETRAADPWEPGPQEPVFLQPAPRLSSVFARVW